VEQTQTEKRDDTARRLGATVGAGSEKNVREAAECSCRPVVPGFNSANAKKRLCTDASKYGLGAALLQLKEERGWLPMGFASRKLKGAEPRYTTTEKESLAVVFGLRKFRHCLYGEKFEVITDYIALTWLLALRDPKKKLARWIVEMQTYDFDVLYERGDGELMAVPDALSRDIMDKDIVLCHRCLECFPRMLSARTGAARKKKRTAKNMSASLERRTL
jgi:RNase H-like domain found in reverse transcriptase